jgi:hypothetical protein
MKGAAHQRPRPSLARCRFAEDAEVIKHWIARKAAIRPLDLLHHLFETHDVAGIHKAHYSGWPPGAVYHRD